MKKVHNVYYIRCNPILGKSIIYNVQTLFIRLVYGCFLHRKCIYFVSRFVLCHVKLTLCFSFEATYIRLIHVHVHTRLALIIHCNRCSFHILVNYIGSDHDIFGSENVIGHLNDSSIKAGCHCFDVNIVKNK